MRRTAAALLAGLIVLTLSLPSGGSSPGPRNFFVMVDELEEIAYGERFEGYLRERVARLETDFFGAAFDGVIPERIERLTSYMADSDRFGPSAQLKMNVLEWLLLERTQEGSLVERLVLCEELVGMDGSGGLMARQEALVAEFFPGGRMEVTSYTISEGELLKVSLLDTLTTKETEIGDRVPFEIAEDLIIGDVLIVPRGATGMATVTDLSRPGHFGRDGRMEVQFDYLHAVDGQKVFLELGEEAQAMNRNMLLAVGASAAGALILSNPVGIVLGAFVRGRHVEYEEGSELYLQVCEPVSVRGLGLSGMGL